jgi:hypothetical protein
MYNPIESLISCISLIFIHVDPHILLVKTYLENCLRTAQVANMAHSSLGRFSPLPRHRLMLDVVTKKRPWLAKYV